MWRWKCHNEFVEINQPPVFPQIPCRVTHGQAVQRRSEFITSQHKAMGMFLEILFGRQCSNGWRFRDGECGSQDCYSSSSSQFWLALSSFSGRITTQSLSYDFPPIERQKGRGYISFSSYRKKEGWGYVRFLSYRKTEGGVTLLFFRLRKSKLL